MKMQASVLSTVQGRAGYIKAITSQLMSQNPGMSRREARRQAVSYLVDACDMVKEQRSQFRRLEREQALFEGTAPDVIGTPSRQPVHVSCRARAAARRDTRPTYGAPRDTKRRERQESGPAVVVRRKAG